MRYTEIEFKIDHVYDFIRVTFSNVFLAPFRLINEYTKKILLLDKELIKTHLKISIIVNGTMIVGELLFVIVYKKFSFNSVAIVLSLPVLLLLYKLSELYDQPVITRKSEEELEESNKPKYKKKDITKSDIDIEEKYEESPVEESTPKYENPKENVERENKVDAFEQIDVSKLEKSSIQIKETSNTQIKSLNNYNICEEMLVYTDEFDAQVEFNAIDEIDGMLVEDDDIMQISDVIEDENEESHG